MLKNRTKVILLSLALATTGGLGAHAGSRVDAWGNPLTVQIPLRSIQTPIVIEPEGILSPSLISDPAGDQGSGPTYGDCLQAEVTNAGAMLKVGQRINGTFPATPPGDVAAYSWRFDTDLNPATGYQEFPYIGIEWEILIQDGGGFWTVNKWSQNTGYIPVANARISIRPNARGDMVFVTFRASEIGSPSSSNWIVWNGEFPTWVDLAPDSTVAFWSR